MTTYIPERNDIVWLDFDLTQWKQIGNYRPVLVLSSKKYNKSTGLLIGCPISTGKAIRGSKTEVSLTNLDMPSVVEASLIQTLSWKDRKVQFIAEAPLGVLQEVLYRILPLLGAESLFES